MMRKDRDTLRKNSYQYGQLRRKLSVSLAMNWLVYTVAFIIAAVLLNATFIPWLADSIADSTSEWHEWKYADYSLDSCLIATGRSYVGIALDIQESPSAQSVGVADELVDAVMTDMADAEAYGFIDEIDSWIDEKGFRYVVVADAKGETITAVRDVPEDMMDSNPILVLYDENQSEGKNGDNGRYYFTMSMNNLQRDAIHAEHLNGVDYRNWQIYDGEDSVMARDLTSYYFVRQFKLPIAICLYLIGCIVLIFLGYGRAMRYFAELSNAVGNLIADKGKPIELSPALSITQDELNSIRLASLADERAAKYAERRKDELVAYLAHDIKTPLTSIMGYLMLLDEAPDMSQEQRQRFVATAAEKAQRLETLMDEFFEITRYNLQAIPIERANVDVHLLLAQVADEFFPEAQAKGIQIEVKAPADELIFVDGDKFARALGNIMRNAIAYADAHSKVQLAAKKDGDHWLITVENKGREISEAHLQSIFEKFYREDEARSSKSGGAGLGLAIAKEIVVSHGGTINAESKNGTTIFTIVLRAQEGLQQRRTGRRGASSHREA